MSKINITFSLHHPEDSKSLLLDAEVCVFYSRWRLWTTYSFWVNEQRANVRAIPCQAFQSNWTDTHEKQCSFECIIWQIFRLLSLKLWQHKNDALWTAGRGENTQWEKEQVFTPVPFTEPNGLWALNALINQYLSPYINNATKLWMTSGTKKGHFNAHKIAPRLVTWARFLSRMITPSQGTEPLTEHWIYWG